MAGKVKGKTWPKRLPTKKQQIFIEEYVATGNGTKAALKAYDTTDNLTAASIANENLNKPYIEDIVAQRLQDAKNMIYVLSQTSEKDEIKLRASQDIVDRIEGKALQKIQQDTTLNMDLQNADLETLIKVAKGLNK